MNNESGYTLFEVLFTLTLSSLLMTMGIYNFKEFQRPLVTGESQLVAFLKQSRTKAIATTSAYHVTGISKSSVVTSYSKNCDSANTTPDNELSLDLPSGVENYNVGWTVCFTARGLADSNIEITLMNQELDTSVVEVLLGGAVHVVEDAV